MLTDILVKGNQKHVKQAIQYDENTYITNHCIYNIYTVTVGTDIDVN